MNSLDNGLGAHHETVPQVRRDRGGVETTWHGTAGEEGAHLGGEEHGFLAGLAIEEGCPIEGLDAHLVTHEVDSPEARVPESQSEDATEALDGVDAPSLVGLENDLRVARGAEGLAQGLEIAPDLREVVDLPVEGDGAPGVGVDHGLGAGRSQVQDGEPPVTEDDFLTARLPQAGPIGSAVALRLADVLDKARDSLAARSRRRIATVADPA